MWQVLSLFKRTVGKKGNKLSRVTLIKSMQRHNGLQTETPRSDINKCILLRSVICEKGQISNPGLIARSVSLLKVILQCFCIWFSFVIDRNLIWWFEPFNRALGHLNTQILGLHCTMCPIYSTILLERHARSVSFTYWSKLNRYLCSYIKWIEQHR